MMIRLQDVLSQEHPSYILAEGDTNTVLATSLVASHMNIPLVHVEAGLRSGNMLMQEERNRIVADRLADLCFAPTEMSYKNLMKEQIEPSRVFVVGNTIVDALGTYLPKLEGNTYLAELGISSEKYILTTVHRAENTGCRTAMQGILHSFELFNEEYGLPIIFPAHPRTEAQLKSRNMSLPEGVQMVRPLGWFDFLALQKNAKLVLTDSGGVQEECCLLHVPCLTLRQETERPETVDVGANILTGTDPDKIIAASREMLRRSTSWVNPFGGGDTASQILGAIAEDWDKNQGGSR
jgi:UDP-N-acetylglucosamine 2-epimerase (non-hydrolysing)